jgi:glutamine synthetase
MEQQQVIQQALDEADRLGLSATAYHFIGGIIASVPGDSAG